MPKMVEVNSSVSYGGKVQIVDFKLNSDFHLSASERWNVEDLSTEEAEAFRIERIEILQQAIEPIAQHEFDERFAQMAGDD